MSGEIVIASPAEHRALAATRTRLASLVDNPLERLRDVIAAREQAFHVYKAALANHSTADWKQAEEDWRESIQATEEAMHALIAAHQAERADRG